MAKLWKFYYRTFCFVAFLKKIKIRNLKYSKPEDVAELIVQLLLGQQILMKSQEILESQQILQWNKAQWSVIRT